jgi:hypothetical protein
VEGKVSKDPLRVRYLEQACDEQFHSILSINMGIALSEVSGVYGPKVSRDFAF